MVRNKPSTAEITQGVPLDLVGEEGTIAQVVLRGNELVITTLNAHRNVDPDILFEGSAGTILAEAKLPLWEPQDPRRPRGADPDLMSRISYLAERLGVHTHAVLEEMVGALTELSVITPAASQLPEHDAQLLDDSGMTASPGAYALAVAKGSAAIAELRVTAASPSQVASALKVSMARVRQLRGERALWAIREGADRWVFPILQFEVDPRDDGVATRQIPGLAVVFQALPQDLHPLAVQGFMLTPQPDLVLDGVPVSPLVWLRGGGDVTAVLNMAQASEYAKR